MGKLIRGPWGSGDDRAVTRIRIPSYRHMSVTRIYRGVFAHLRAAWAYDSLCNDTNAFNMVTRYRPTRDPRTWFSSGVEASARHWDAENNQRLEQIVMSTLGKRAQIRFVA